MSTQHDRLIRARDACVEEFAPRIKDLGLHLAGGLTMVDGEPAISALCQSRTRQPPGKKLQKQVRDILGDSFECEGATYSLKIRFMGLIIAHGDS